MVISGLIMDRFGFKWTPTCVQHCGINKPKLGPFNYNGRIECL